MRSLVTSITVVLLATLSFAQNSPNLPNLQEARKGVYLAGQPDQDGFKQAANLGIKMVINLLPNEMLLEGEEVIVKDLNMAYERIPVAPANFTIDRVKEFNKLLKSNRQKVILVHCKTGNHAAGLWFANRVMMEKAPLGAALKEARSLGMQLELENIIFDWVAREADNLRAEEQGR